MRIGFDAKRLFFNETGLGVYSRLLVEQLQSAYPDHTYILFTPKTKGSNYLDRFRSLPIISSRRPFFRSWGMAKAIKTASIDIYHGLSHELPIGIDRKVKTVVTIHDLIFERYPEMYPLIDRKIYQWKWRYSCREADLIISVSEQTKKDILHYYGVDASKIRVFPPMVSNRFFQEIEEEQISMDRKRYQLPERYFLFVGSITQRKNLKLVIQAMSLLPPGIRLPLVVVGNKGDAYRDVIHSIKRHGLAEEVHFFQTVTNDDLPVLYRLATALIYPSLFEGFGIPIVESLQSGTPVITSDISSMPEAGGKGALYIDPKDPHQLARKMQEIQDPLVASPLVKFGRDHIKRFDPAFVGQKIFELYTQLLE